MLASLHPFQKILIAAVSMLVALPAGAAIYAVGPEPGCTHATIQAAINSAEANFGHDFIRIPHSQVWNNQALVINTSQDLSLEGFWSDCNTIDTGGTRTTLDGAGGSAAPVLRIEGSGHVIGLDSLTIRNGDVGGNAGKAVDLLPRKRLTPHCQHGNHQQQAGLGGGMYLEGTARPRGAGLRRRCDQRQHRTRQWRRRVRRSLQFLMLYPNSIIAFNTATGYPLLGTTVGGYGGGLVVNPSRGSTAAPK